MPSLDEIRREVQSIPEEGMHGLCTRLFEQLASRAHLRDTRWTYRQLSKLIGADAASPEFQACVDILATRPGAKMLDIHFLYYDPTDPDSIGEPISDADVVFAYQNGYFIEPHSGEAITDFESYLLPYFQLRAMGAE